MFGPFPCATPRPLRGAGAPGRAGCLLAGAACLVPFAAAPSRCGVLPSRAGAGPPPNRLPGGRRRSFSAPARPAPAACAAVVFFLLAGCAERARPRGAAGAPEDVGRQIDRLADPDADERFRARWAIANVG